MMCGYNGQEIALDLHLPQEHWIVREDGSSYCPLSGKQAAAFAVEYLLQLRTDFGKQLHMHASVAVMGTMLHIPNLRM